MNMSKSDANNDETCNRENPSANINVSELDAETNQKLKGDAIGDTLYSQSFVLKTLLQFSNFEWSDQFEEDVCFLWDMTVEKEVCSYLFDLSFPSVACAALEQNEEPRFKEIIIGILGNIVCMKCANEKMTDNEIDIVLKELSSDDPLVLVQVMRFISATVHKADNAHWIDEEKMFKINFILNNSVKDELLAETLDTVAKLTVDNKLDPKLVNLNLYKSALNAYSTIISHYEEYSLDSKDRLSTCKHSLEIICNICTYVDNFENYELLLELQRDSNKYVNEILKILEYFCVEENIFPVTDEIIFFMSVFRYTLTTLNINFISSLFTCLCKILLLIVNNQDEIGDMFDSTVDLLCFLISQDTNQEYVSCLTSFSKHKAKSILNVLNDNQHKYNYEINIQDLRHEYLK